MADSGVVKLIMRQGPRAGQEYELDKDVYAIGREAGNDLVIEDAQISRHHARLTRQGNSYLIEDLGSTNGTFVNGSRVTEPTLLNNGDMLGLADTVVLAVEIPLMDVGATVVGQPAGVDSTAVHQPPVTQPTFTPPPPQGVAQQPRQQSYPPPPPQQQRGTYPPPPAQQPAGSSNNRRMLLIGCGWLVLLVIVVLIALVAWSFIDCASFSKVFPFVFPPFDC